MKLFNKKEEKLKVGRPRLVDSETKKKSFIMLGVSLALVIILLGGGLVSFNIIPKFNKLKGTVNVNLCNEIPAKYQPRSESNPEGTYEYGFTDPKFYSAVVSTYNRNSSYCSTITEDELKSITNLSIDSRNIDNADGIEYLINLTDLYIGLKNIGYTKGNLTSIDVSQNTALTTLDLDNNKIDSIDLSQNTALTSLDLHGNNKLTSIDLSNNTALTTVNLSNNNLTSIDLSNNIALTSLELDWNNLSGIDVSNNTALTSLSLWGNKLTSIDVSNNTALTSLSLWDNKLTSIDVSNNIRLIDLKVSISNLNSIDNIRGIENLKSQLKTLYVSNSNLTKINLNEFPNLTTLYLSGNNISSIDVSNNTALTSLSLRSNKLTSIDVSQNTALTSLDLSFNKIRSIDLSQNTALTSLDLSYNDFAKSYITTYDSITIEPNVITAYPNDTTYSIDDTSIAIYNNGIVEKVKTGSTTLSANYKLSRFKSFQVTYKIEFVELELTSSSYTINEEEKTIDINGELLSNVSTLQFSISPSSYKLNINSNKLEIKDSSGNIVDTYTFKNYVLYKLTSSNYTISEEEKTIDVKGEVLNNINTWSFSITPSSYSLNISNDKLEIKDSSGNVVDTYTLKNYALYKLQSSLYTINDEEKTIDANNNLAHYSFILISPSEFRINQNNDKLEIKDSSGNVIDTYKFINYSKYKLTSSTYTIDDNNKTIDVKGKILDKNKIYINSPNQYVLRVNEDKLEILDSDKNVVDNYEIINARPKVEDAYLKAGFKDKNLYTCVVRYYADSNYDDMNEKSEYISGDYLLTDEEMNNIGNLYCINKNISDTTGIEKLTNLEVLVLPYNNIETIDLGKFPKLWVLVLGNNKLTSLDLSKNPNLGHLEVPNNKIKRIKGLEKLEELSALIAYNNNLSDLDISKTTNLELLMVSNNPLANTLYMLKGKEIDYKKDFKLNETYELKYDITDTNVISYKESRLKAIKEGVSTVYISNENIYNYKIDLWDKSMACEYLMDQKACEFFEDFDEEDEEKYILPYLISQEVKVYDITSKEYKIDKDKKIIDALNKDFDASKVNLTLNGLTGTLENDKFIIKDKDVIVDTYAVTNIKKVIKEEVVSDSKNGTKVKPSDKVIEKIEERKEKAEEKLEDIIIEGENVPLSTLLLIKGKDRNIVVKNEEITITINGKDIDNISGNLDLSYEINILKESLIYNEVKDKLKNGMVLRFKNNKEIPYKMLIEIEVTDKIEKEIGRKNLYLYNYNNDKYSLVAEDLSSYNNKISFYVNKQGNYILTNNKIEDKSVKTDKSIIEDNTKLVKEINYKKIIIPIIIFILLIILGIIGYVRYKKKK